MINLGSTVCAILFCHKFLRESPWKIANLGSFRLACWLKDGDVNGEVGASPWPGLTDVLPSPSCFAISATCSCTMGA